NPVRGAAHLGLGAGEHRGDLRRVPDGDGKQGSLHLLPALRGGSAGGGSGFRQNEHFFWWPGPGPITRSHFQEAPWTHTRSSSCSAAWWSSATCSTRWRNMPAFRP